MIHLLIPVPGPIIQQWSQRHPAIDIACLLGSPIVAAHSGKAEVYYDFQMGNVVKLYGEDGIITSYSHLSKTKGNGMYNVGDIIGECGSTGTLSSGTHLHFESNQSYQF